MSRIKLSKSVVLNVVELEVLLHYAYRRDDFLTSPAYVEAANRLQYLGLIELKKAEEDFFVLTERGLVYVGAVKCLPLPVDKWVM